MKKLKIIIILFAFNFILTGCSIQYNLNINEKTINENFNIVDEELTDTDNTNKMIEEELAIPRPSIRGEYDNPYSMVEVEGVSYYKKNVINNNSSKGINYLFDFNFSDFSNSAAFRTCYQEINIENKDLIFSLSTSPKFFCYEIFEQLDTVSVNITTKYKVISNNADTVKGNKYTWIITKDNANNKPINIKVKLEKDSIIDYNLLFIFGTIGIIAIIIILIVRRKSAISNKL